MNTTLANHLIILSLTPGDTQVKRELCHAICCGKPGALDTKSRWFWLHA